MNGRRILLFLLLTLGGTSLYAVRTPGLSMKSFRSSIVKSTGDVVMSPYAFELDCAVISEAFDSIGKSKFVEFLGALVGYDSIYQPLSARYGAARTNDFDLVSGRAFLAPSLRSVSVKYRTFVQREYGVQVCPYLPTPAGAESFLVAAMDGQMEDFKVPGSVLESKRVSFVDLECLRCHWLNPFPTDNTRRMAFAGADGRKSEMVFIADVRPAELWETRRFTMLRLPLTDGAFFHAVLPARGVPLSAVFDDFEAEKFDSALVIVRSITDPGVFRGPVAVVLPRLQLDSMVDLAPILKDHGLPYGGFKEIYNGEGARLTAIVQRTCFSLDETGPGGQTIKRKSESEETRIGKDNRRFVANRPFLFFVYHEPTQTVPVAGVFTGANK